MDAASAVPEPGPSSPRRSPRPQAQVLSPPEQQAPPPLFLPPPAPPPPPAHFRSTDDLLGKFLLLDAYNQYVRPHFATTTEPGSAIDVKPPIVPGGPMDKGKGKEIPHTTPMTPHASGAMPQDGDEEDTAASKTKKNSYKHLIKGVPGKHSMKKDDYLSLMMQIPPKQRVKIHPFDLKTQEDAFSVSLEGIKGWNPNVLVLESAQAREDRKKRKELKRLAKAQALAQAQAAAVAASNQLSSLPFGHSQVHAPRPTLATPSSFPRSATPTSASLPRASGSGTPRPVSTPKSAALPTPTAAVRPGSAKPALGILPVPSLSSGGKVGTPLRTGTPTVPHPLSAPPLSASSLGSASLPAVASSNLPADKRGVKREREDHPMNGHTPALVTVNGTALPRQAQQQSTATPPLNIPGMVQPVLNALSGARPKKKQRMDVQGQARNIPAVQQPTPQGV